MDGRKECVELEARTHLGIPFPRLDPADSYYKYRNVVNSNPPKVPKTKRKSRFPKKKNRTNITIYLTFHLLFEWDSGDIYVQLSRMEKIVCRFFHHAVLFTLPMSVIEFFIELELFTPKLQ